jgi:hypothetical protein
MFRATTKDERYKPRPRHAGHRIANDLLLFHIPVNLAPAEHGNQAKRSGNGGVVRYRDRHDRRFPGSDPIEDATPPLV